jgi:DNA repair exonuclease SbcCD ATPase subunit
MQRDRAATNHREITRGEFLIDISTILVSFLLAVTVGVAVKYYGVLRRARKEYEEAREAVEDVVLSFNRQLQRETGKLETIAYKVEALSSRVDSSSKTANQVQETMEAMENRLAPALQDRENMSTRMEEFDKRMQELGTSQSALATRISSLDEQVRQFLATPEPNVQAVIPIKRDRALEPLTQTELSVLEMLTSEGPKTAPTIKDQLKLSREHTARLMKKLYEGGYLERDTGKIPFKYSVKKEMEALLKKTERETV